MPRTAFSIFSSIVVCTLLLAACGGGSTTKPEPTTSSPTADVEMLVGSNDIAVGSNRLVFALLDREGNPFGPADVRMRFFHMDGPDPKAVKSEAAARYLGDDTPTARALYSVRVPLDGTGGWEMEATVRRGNDSPRVLRAAFRVKSKSDVPAIGDAAPRTASQTLRDAPIEQLTSQRPPGDPDFYRLSIADALDQRKPFLLLFATPAFCQTRTCGPELEVAQALKTVYGDRMNFLHIEVFDRPDLLLDGKTQPVYRAAVREWRLLIEPITFLVDASGRIADRFEGFAPRAELEEAIRKLLG